MASAVKVAAFGSLLRIFVDTFHQWDVDWQPVVYALAVASLVVGAVLAAVQTDVKRMMAYSSINHAGFILLGVQAASADGTAAALFYLAAYAAITAGTFGIITIVAGRRDAKTSVDDFAGLSRRRPALALGFTVLLLAQAGCLHLRLLRQVRRDRRRRGCPLVLAGGRGHGHRRRVRLRLPAGGRGHVHDRRRRGRGPKEDLPWSAGLGVALSVGITLWSACCPG